MNDVRKSIGWADYTINSVKGLCAYACPYCYARRMYERFHWNQEVRYDFGAADWEKLQKLPPGARIFFGSTHDLMGEWIPSSWIEDSIIPHVAALPQHTFFFLSKNPGRYRSFEWPANCWLGATVTGRADLGRFDDLYELKIERVDTQKIFVSFEPLLEEIRLIAGAYILDWAIIGGLTPSPRHKSEWIDHLLTALDASRVPVYIKKNAHYQTERKNKP